MKEIAEAVSSEATDDEAQSEPRGCRAPRHVPLATGRICCTNQHRAAIRPKRRSFPLMDPRSYLGTSCPRNIPERPWRKALRRAANWGLVRLSGLRKPALWRSARIIRRFRPASTSCPRRAVVVGVQLIITARYCRDGKRRFPALFIDTVSFIRLAAAMRQICGITRIDFQGKRIVDNVVDQRLLRWFVLCQRWPPFRTMNTVCRPGWTFLEYRNGAIQCTPSCFDDLPARRCSLRWPVKDMALRWPRSLSARS